MGHRARAAAGQLVVLEIITPTQSEVVNNVIIAVLQLFVAFGLLNDLTHADRF